MAKDNTFRSSSFYTAEGDVLHILINKEGGSDIAIGLMKLGEEGNVPLIPIATTASDVTTTSFTANWEFQENTLGYYLDVSTDSDFATFVIGYNNLDVGSVNILAIGGLISYARYYYRLRAYNDVGASANSNIIRVRGELFATCLVRNAEVDNSLSIAGSTLLAISNKVGQQLTVNNLPDYAPFDKTGWVAMLSDDGKMTGGVDPSTSGDYLYRYFCTINRGAKTLTFDGGYALTNWTIGDNLVLYNPFLNYEFVGNQTVNPLISSSGSDTWRDLYTVGGSVFKRGDDVYIWMITGYGSLSQGVGYAYSGDGITWAMGNSDTPVFTPDMITEEVYTSISTTGSIAMDDGTGRRACLITCVRTSDSKNITRLLYFDENFLTITYSDSLLDETIIFGCVGGSIVKIGNEYHMLYSAMYAAPVDREQRAAVCATIDGVYVDYQMIVSGVGANTGVAYSNHADSISGFEYQNAFFGFFGGTSKYANSGTRGNREYCLIEYNISTGLWDISDKGAVFLNPLYYSSMDGTYAWCSDHGGGYTSFFLDDNGDIYMSSTMIGSVYHAALMKF